jgi:hypothetical protein
MFFLQYLLGRFKSKGGSRETNQQKKKKKKESIDMETWQNTQDIYIDHPVLKQERSRERSLQKYS